MALDAASSAASDSSGTDPDMPELEESPLHQERSPRRVRVSAEAIRGATGRNWREKILAAASPHEQLEGAAAEEFLLNGPFLRIVCYRGILWQEEGKCGELPVAPCLYCCNNSPTCQVHSVQGCCSRACLMARLLDDAHGAERGDLRGHRGLLSRATPG